MQESSVLWFLAGVALLILLFGIGFGIKWRKELAKENSKGDQIVSLNLPAATSEASSSKRAMLSSIRGLLLILVLFLILSSQEGMLLRSAAFILFAVYIAWTGYDLWAGRKEERAIKNQLKNISKM